MAAEYDSAGLSISVHCTLGFWILWIPGIVAFVQYKFTPPSLVRECSVQSPSRFLLQTKAATRYSMVQLMGASAQNYTSALIACHMHVER